MYIDCINPTLTHTSNMHSPQQYNLDEYPDSRLATNASAAGYGLSANNPPRCMSSLTAGGWCRGRSIHQGELMIILPCGAQLRPGFCCTETRIYTIPRTIMRSRNDQRVKTHSKPCITNGKRREYVTVAEQHCSNGEIAHSVLYCCSPHLSSIIPLAHTIMFFWRTGKATCMNRSMMSFPSSAVLPSIIALACRKQATARKAAAANKLAMLRADPGAPTTRSSRRARQSYM
jgi:hypothetical protein